MYFTYFNTMSTTGSFRKSVFLLRFYRNCELVCNSWIDLLLVTYLGKLGFQQTLDQLCSFVGLQHRLKLPNTLSV